MAQLAVKHENQQIVEYHDFSGGLNTSNAPEYIGTNELAQAVNVEIDNGTGLLKTVAGVVQSGTLRSGHNWISAAKDHVGGATVYFDENKEIWAEFTLEDKDYWMKVGDLSGDLFPQWAVWEDGIVISSGGRLQYFHLRNHITTDIFETIREAPDKCDGVFVKDGRVWVYYEDIIHVSGVGDEHSWGDTSWGDKYQYGVDNFTLAMLHFDEADNPYKDEAETLSWTAPEWGIIGASGAKFSSSLRLKALSDGGLLFARGNSIYASGVTMGGTMLGGKSFTVDCWLKSYSLANRMTGITVVPESYEYNNLIHFDGLPLYDVYGNYVFPGTGTFVDSGTFGQALSMVAATIVRTCVTLTNSFTIDFRAKIAGSYKIELVQPTIDDAGKVTQATVLTFTCRGTTAGAVAFAITYPTGEKGSANLTGVSQDWHHVAIVSNEGVYQIYFDGAALLETPYEMEEGEVEGEFEVVVNKGWGSQFVKGTQLDEFRVTGRSAVWTENFTPPTEPYAPEVVTSGMAVMHNNQNYLLTWGGGNFEGLGKVIRSAAWKNNTWTHFALVYDANERKFYFFIDGTKVREVEAGFPSGQYNIRIYGEYIDELRISDIERWTEDFDVPTDRYGSDYRDDGDDSAAWVEIGYKDGGNIVAMTNLANDILVFKDNNYAYRLVGQYPDWEIKEISRDVPCRNRLACVSLVNEAVVLGDNTLQIVSVTQDYGEMRADDAGYKIHKNIVALPNDVRLRYLPVLNQIWFITGGKVVLFYTIKEGAFFLREFATGVMDAFAVGDTVYVLKSEGLMKLDDSIFTDNGTPLMWKWQGKSIVSYYEYLLKRIQCWFTQLTDSKPACEITVGNVVVSPDFAGGSSMTAHNSDMRCVERAKTFVIKGQGRGGQLLFDSIACEIAEV